MADRVISVRSGMVVSEQRNDNPAPVSSIEW
jgi:hypothetical protein